MALSLSVGQNSHGSTEEPANILNGLALDTGRNLSPSRDVSASRGRRRPRREHQALKKPESMPKQRLARKVHSIPITGPQRRSERIAGKLKMPSKSRASHQSLTSTNDVAAHSSYDDEDSDYQIQALSSNHEESLDQYEDTEHSELFGEDVAWEKVIEGARNVGVPESNDSQSESLSSPETLMIMNIVKNTKKARRLFQRLSRERDITENDIEAAKVQLEEALEQIDVEIMELDEAAAEAQTSETFTDVYAHAISNLIFMLQSALRCRTMHYSSPDDLESLRSMISIQDTILLLCQKAKVYYKTSIVRPTKQKIAPYLRDVRDAFQAELNQRERSIALKRTERLLEESHQRRLEKMIKEKEENAQKRMENALRIKIDLDQKYELRFGPTQREQQRRYPTHQPVSTDRWTDDESLQLMVQLQNPESRHLPGVCPEYQSCTPANSTFSGAALSCNTQLAASAKQTSRAYSKKGVVLQERNATMLGER